MDRDLKGELTCPVCMELFSNPLRLGCGHSYCRRCLMSIERRSAPNAWDVVGNTTFISCPECRRIFDLPSTGVDSFPVDFKLSKLVEVYRKMAKSIGQDSEESSENLDLNSVTAALSTTTQVEDIEEIDSEDEGAVAEHPHEAAENTSDAVTELATAVTTALSSAEDDDDDEGEEEEREAGGACVEAPLLLPHDDVDRSSNHLTTSAVRRLSRERFVSSLSPSASADDVWKAASECNIYRLLERRQPRSFDRWSARAGPDRASPSADRQVLNYGRADELLMAGSQLLEEIQELIIVGDEILSDADNILDEVMLSRAAALDTERTSCRRDRDVPGPARRVSSRSRRTSGCLRAAWSRDASSSVDAESPGASGHAVDVAARVFGPFRIAHDGGETTACGDISCSGSSSVDTEASGASRQATSDVSVAVSDVACRPRFGHVARTTAGGDIAADGRHRRAFRAARRRRNNARTTSSSPDRGFWDFERRTATGARRGAVAGFPDSADVLDRDEEDVVGESGTRGCRGLLCVRHDRSCAARGKRHSKSGRRGDAAERASADDEDMNAARSKQIKNVANEAIADAVNKELIASGHKEIVSPASEEMVCPGNADTAVSKETTGAAKTADRTRCHGCRRSGECRRTGYAGGAVDLVTAVTDGADVNDNESDSEDCRRAPPAVNETDHKMTTDNRNAQNSGVESDTCRQERENEDDADAVAERVTKSTSPTRTAAAAAAVGGGQRVSSRAGRPVGCGHRRTGSATDGAAIWAIVDRDSYREARAMYDGELLSVARRSNKTSNPDMACERAGRGGSGGTRRTSSGSRRLCCGSRRPCGRGDNSSADASRMETANAATVAVVVADGTSVSDGCVAVRTTAADDAACSDVDREAPEMRDEVNSMTFV